MSDIYSLMVEESRQNFFQVENLFSAIDTKAFGVVTIDAILFPIFAYILSLKQHPTLLLYVPSFILLVSLIFLILCIWPYEWRRQISLATINKYGNIPYEKAASQLAINYANWEDQLTAKYWDKYWCFKRGLIITVSALISEIFIYLLFGY